MTEFLAFTITGIVTGAVYAVAASGLVVTYTTSGIFNFAHGAMGMLMAFLYWQLRVHMHWPAPFALIVVLLTGLLVTNLIGRRLIVYGEELLNRIPLVGTVYGGVKSFAESVFSQSNAFRRVVMIEYPRAGAWSIGFLTAEDVPEASEKLHEPHVAVYISSALNATAGYLVIVPRRAVVELDMSVDAAMKMIITCGVVVPPAAPRSTSLAKPAA